MQYNRITKILNYFTWSECKQSYISYTSSESDLKFLTSLRFQFNKKGSLSEKQIQAAEQIINKYKNL